MPRKEKLHLLFWKISIFLMLWRKYIVEHGVNDKIALRVVEKDSDIETDFIEREKLLSVVLVVLK